MCSNRHVLRDENEDVIRYLLQNGADPNIGQHWMHINGPGAPTDRRCGQALERAAIFCSARIVDLLLSHGAKLEYSLPIHSAATAHSWSTNDRSSMVTHLIELGVDINGVDSNHREIMFRRGTPLLECYRDQRQEGVELLLRLGACPSPMTQPRWYVDLVAKVKQDKGEAQFWKDVRSTAAKAQPHWQKTKTDQPWALQLIPAEYL